MNLVVCKSYLGGPILYRSLVPPIKNGVIALSEGTIPIVELQTKETEYIGAPYNQCSGKNEKLAGSINGKYDIAACMAMRKVQNIIKRLCLNQKLSPKIV